MSDCGRSEDTQMKNQNNKNQNADKQSRPLNTEIRDGNDRQAIHDAADILRRGGLVAFPTETVYGLGANALNPSAAAKIYEAKGRPGDNPLIVHIADTEDIGRLAADIPDKALMLAEAFWPGPLTIILPKRNIVPDQTTGGLATVAIRMPSHPAALALIRESKLYIAAPSANLSGRPSPTRAEHVAEDMTGRIDMILDGGAVGIGIESTIVDLTGATPAVLRPGYITKAMLEQIIGHVELDPALVEADSTLRPRAPGMKYTHYAPKGTLTIVEASAAGRTPKTQADAAQAMRTDAAQVNMTQAAQMNSRVADVINQLVCEKQTQGYKAAVLTCEENAALYACEHILVMGRASASEGNTVAAHLYAALRECDARGIDYIYSEAFHQGPMGGAIMNRLLKAAGQRVISV